MCVYVCVWGGGVRACMRVCETERKIDRER